MSYLEVDTKKEAYKLVHVNKIIIFIILEIW